MSRKVLVLMCSIFLIVPLLFMGCTGDDGSTGATGARRDPGAGRAGPYGDGQAGDLRHLSSGSGRQPPGVL